MRLRRESDCEICTRVVIIASTPNEIVGNFNLRDEVLRLVGLPIPNHVDLDNFFLISESRKTVYKKNSSSEKLLMPLPSTKDNSEEAMSIKHAKKPIVGAYLQKQRLEKILSEMTLVLCTTCFLIMLISQQKVIVRRHRDAIR